MMKRMRPRADQGWVSRRQAARNDFAVKSRNLTMGDEAIVSRTMHDKKRTFRHHGIMFRMCRLKAVKWHLTNLVIIIIVRSMVWRMRVMWCGGFAVVRWQRG